MAFKIEVFPRIPSWLLVRENCDMRVITNVRATDGRMIVGETPEFRSALNMPSNTGVNNGERLKSNIPNIPDP